MNTHTYPHIQVLQIPSQFPYVIIVAVLMSWQLWYYGIQVSNARKQIFGIQFMRQNWGQIHYQQIGQRIMLGGLPDTGSGHYSQKLSYKDWYNFNILQRLHLNYVEGINLVQVTMIACGIYKPRIAAIAGFLYIIGKFIFASGYLSKMGGLSKRRIFGITLCYTSSAINSIVFGYYIIRWMVL